MATFESSSVRQTPETAADRLLNAVEGLDSDSKRALSRCVTRRLDFSWECCAEPFESSFAFGNANLARMARAGATMAVTMYLKPETSDDESQAKGLSP